ncbi:MAG TPA: hypothetical protein VFY60_13750 [Pyrinomonadaceae bacterium]|nr:hypothetical protein [Pyrinomonadaceae bacterium]
MLRHASRPSSLKLFFVVATLAFFVEATPGSIQAQTLGQFTFNDQQFGNFLTESDGGSFRNTSWLNVVNANPGNPGALTGANFDTGIANIGLSGGLNYIIHYDTPIRNGLGDDLGIVSARFSTNDTFHLAVSTDGTNFTPFVSFGPELAVNSGVVKTYFFGSTIQGPFTPTLFVTPVDLSVFGLPLGGTISAVKITSSPEGDLIRVAGFRQCLPPTITSASATPNVLWPPNLKMVPVTVSVSTEGGCDAVSCRITTVESNEPINEGVDWVITGDLTLNLRARRLGTGSGRVYTLTVQCIDSFGNSATKTITVAVSHDQRK